MDTSRRHTPGYGPSIPKPKDCRPSDYRKEKLTSSQLTRLLYVILKRRQDIINALTMPLDELWDENERMSKEFDGSPGGVNKPFGCHITLGKHIVMRLLRETDKDAVDAILHDRYRQGAQE